MMLDLLFALSILITYCLATPVALTKVGTLDNFQLDDHLVPLNAQVSASGVNDNTKSDSKILVLDSQDYARLDLYGVEHPVLVLDEASGNWRFISRPTPKFNSSGIFDWWSGSDDEGDDDEQQKDDRQKSQPDKGYGQGRYEIRGSASAPFLLEPKLPISSCIDSTFGSGASVGKSISFGFNSGIGGDIAIGDGILSFLSWTVSASVSGSISLQFSVSCSADAGESVQMFLAPWAIQAETSHREIVEYKGYRAESDDWSNPVVSEWGVLTPPETYCFTSNMQSCAIPGLDTNAFTIDRVTYI